MRHPHKLTLWLCLLFIGSFAHSADRPNFVFIVSEDNSIHYLDHFFPGGAKTPAIEALAAQGLTFDRAYSNAPVCSTARTTLATGCYGPRIGTQYHRRYEKAQLPADVKLWHTYLQQAGYHTTNRSKQDYNVEPVTGWDKSAGDAHWRDRAEGQPFFHMASHGDSHEGRLHFSQESYESDKTTHDPAEVQLADYFPDTDLFRYTHARYLDCMLTIDGIVANTVAQLEADGVLEDTFVFYFGDHGGVLPRGKGYPYESGVHVPLVVRIPENFKHLVDGQRGDRVGGYVSFIDFGPTVLHLAGVPGSSAVDGTPFLGDGITMEQVNARDEVFCYADRFDEKYDLIRSLHKGKYHYLRCYQNWLPDGLQNNYRYKMLAYEEWRQLYQAGELDEVRSQFHRGKPVELLFDIEADPHEVKNLADDPAHAETLAIMRQRLNTRVKALPDLSFYPESQLVSQAMADPVAYGQKHKAAIARYVDIADLATRPFAEAKAGLQAALTSTDAIARYWGCMVCSSFGEQAAALAPMAEGLLSDESEVVRLRAAEAVGLCAGGDAITPIVELINSTADAVVATEALNSLVYFVDCHPSGKDFDAAALAPQAEGADIPRRVPYLKGEDLFPPKKKKKKEPVKAKKNK